MFSDLSWLGILVCVYAFARLLHYAHLRLDDSGKHKFISKILLFICSFLWLLSTPVSIVLGILNTLHFRRLDENLNNGYGDNPHKITTNESSSLSLRIIAVILLVLVIAGYIQNNQLEDEILALESEIEELSCDYDRGYEEGFDAARHEYLQEGYASGYPDGYDEGYSEGQEIGYAEGYSSGYLAAVVDYADSNTNETLGIAILTILQTHEEDAEAFIAAYEWVKNWRYSHFGR